MTIAISLKVNDGVVLAADSASTLLQPGRDGSVAVVNVYNNANKIYNLRKGLPLGALTWGSGSIGVASTSTLAKDFRRKLTTEGSEWCIDPSNYKVFDIAERLREFIYEGHYLPAFAEWPQKPELGFVIVGFSSGEQLAEEYQFTVTNGECQPVQPLRSMDESGITWNGMPEAITRIMFGISTITGSVLSQAGLADQADTIIGLLKSAQVAPLVQAAMPIEDAANLAEFLVDLTVRYSRFMPGPDSVGGPVEVAAITKHEGFKWLKRKHYFNPQLNPKEGY